MTQRKYILFVALVFTGFFAIGQGYKPAPKDIGRLVNENKKWGTHAVNSLFQYKYNSKTQQLKPVEIDLPLPATKPTILLPLSVPVLKESSGNGFSMLQPNSYYEHLGFFCKKEIQLQRITTVPVKVRLGSYDYVNWLEGKDRH